MNIEILLVALMTGLATSLIGVFLVLRQMSMMTDAISHTILLGIVITFMWVGSLTSPFLLVGATMMGVLTAYGVEILYKSRRIKEDAAIGVVFTFLFSLAILIVTLRFRNIHLDVHMVLLGKIEFVIFERFSLFGLDLGPTSLFVMGFAWLLSFLFVTLFYKELKLTSFDPALASVLGFAPVVLHYGLMTLVSLTAVAAFNAVGAILVIALMIGPPVTALMLTKTLFKTLILTQLIALLNTAVGYVIAYILDITISGTMASVTLLTFLIVMISAPQKGILAQVIRRTHQKERLALATLIRHVANHENTPEAFDELDVTRTAWHLRWSPRYYRRKLRSALHKDLLEIVDACLTLTHLGRQFIQQLDQDASLIDRKVRL